MAMPPQPPSLVVRHTVLVSSRLIWLLNADHIMIRTDLLRERSPGVAASCVLSSELLCPRLVGGRYLAPLPAACVRASPVQELTPSGCVCRATAAARLKQWAEQTSSDKIKVWRDIHEPERVVTGGRADDMAKPVLVLPSAASVSPTETF